MKKLESFICIDNTPRVFKDGSTDRASEFLTVGKTYIGFYNTKSFCKDGDIRREGDAVFIEKTDLGGFPQGHQWFNSSRFILLSELREDKLNDLGI